MEVTQALVPEKQRASPRHFETIDVSKTKRFDALTRKRTRAQIWSLKRAGLEPQQIAEAMNNSKYPPANGGKWNAQKINSQMFYIRANRKAYGSLTAKRGAVQVDPEPTIASPQPEPLEIPKVVTPAPTPTPTPTPTPRPSSMRLPPSIALMMEDEELTSQQKLAALKAVKAKLPASVQLMLEDDELSDRQRMDVLCTLLGIKG